MSYGPRSTYVSPFVADALYRAKLRGNIAVQQRQRKQSSKINNRVNQNVSSSAEWDSSTGVRDLFDPELKKQEIFKLQPKRSSNVKQDDASVGPKDNPNVVSPMDHPNTAPQKLTRRRDDVSIASKIVFTV